MATPVESERIPLPAGTDGSNPYRFVALRYEKPREKLEAQETEQYQLFETSQYKYRLHTAATIAFQSISRGRSLYEQSQKFLSKRSRCWPCCRVQKCSSATGHGNAVKNSRI